MVATQEIRPGKLIPEVRQTYRNRIAELREYGVEDGVIVNPASEKDFWAFVKSLPTARPGSLVLMDNGNLRAVWKGDQGSHLGLQFLGRRMVEYVIFKRRPRAKQVSRVAGADTFDGVKRLTASSVRLTPLIWKPCYLVAGEIA